MGHAAWWLGLIAWMVVGIWGVPGLAMANEGEIKVGVLLPLSGRLAIFGEEGKFSYKMAEASMNAQGGVKGKKVRFLFANTRSLPEVGVREARRLLEKEQVTVLAGGYDSAVTVAIAKEAIHAGVPFLVHSGMADAITMPETYTVSEGELEKRAMALKGEEDPERREKIFEEIGQWKAERNKEVEALTPRFMVFRLNPTMGEALGVLEEFLSEVVKPLSAVVLYEESMFGRDVAEEFVKISTRMSMKILMDAAFGGEFKDSSRLLLHARDKAADVVLLASSSRESENLLIQSMELKMMPRLFIGMGRGFSHPDFAKAAGKAGEKVVSVVFWHPTLPFSGAELYQHRYQQQTEREASSDGAYAYASAWVIFDALNRAPSLGRDEVFEALQKTNLMTAVGSVKFIRYQGKVNQNQGGAHLVQWIDGKQWIVWPQKLAGRGYVYPIDWIQERQ